MKMKKMAGALALSAALAMGTAMPAFAASATTDTEFSGTSGSTEIKASVEDTMLKATVPLHVAIVFGAAEGESDIIAPAASSYAITNTGDGSIKLVNAEIEDGATGLTIDGWGLLGKNTIYGSAGAKVASDGNYVMLTYDDGTNCTYLAPNHALKDAFIDDSTYDDTYVGENAKDFSEVTIAKGAKLPIQLGGSTKFGTAIDNDGLTDTLCTIKYTIAKA